MYEYLSYVQRPEYSWYEAWGGAEAWGRESVKVPQVRPSQQVWPQQNTAVCGQHSLPVLFLKPFPCWLFSLQLADPHSWCKPPPPFLLQLLPTFIQQFLKMFAVGQEVSLFPSCPTRDASLYFIFFEFQDTLSLKNPGCTTSQQSAWLREFTFTMFLVILWLSIQLVRLRGGC